MSREALQTALLDAYAAMDAMEAQLTTLERQLGVKPEPLLASRGSCTQPLQPLPPPPLPLYTSTTTSLPSARDLAADVARPVARCSSMPASLTPTPPEEAAPMRMPTPILGSAASSVSVSTAAKPSVSLPSKAGPVARPPPAIAFRSQSGGFQPYAQGCKRPATSMIERSAVTSCALPSEVSFLGDVRAQEGPSIKRIRLTC